MVVYVIFVIALTGTCDVDMASFVTGKGAIAPEPLTVQMNDPTGHHDTGITLSLEISSRRLPFVLIPTPAPPVKPTETTSSSIGGPNVTVASVPWSPAPPPVPAVKRPSARPSRAVSFAGDDDSTIGPSASVAAAMHWKYSPAVSPAVSVIDGAFGVDSLPGSPVLPKVSPPRAAPPATVDPVPVSLPAPAQSSVLSGPARSVASSAVARSVHPAEQRLPQYLKDLAQESRENMARIARVRKYRRVITERCVLYV